MEQTTNEIAIDENTATDTAIVEENLISQANNSLIAKNYMRRLSLLMFGWLLIILGFIWIIDPYGVSPIHIHLPGINTLKPERIDIDRLIKPYEVWRDQPKTIYR